MLLLSQEKHQARKTSGTFKLFAFVYIDLEFAFSLIMRDWTHLWLYLPCGWIVLGTWEGTAFVIGTQLALLGQSQTEYLGLKCVPGPQDWITAAPFQQLANFVQSWGTGLNPV